MMFRKKTLYLSFILFAICCTLNYRSNAQEDKDAPEVFTKDASGAYVYQNVMSFPGLTQSELYDRVKKWVVTTLKSQDNNISFDDKDKGSIATATTLLLKPQYIVPNHVMDFKLSISFKEGKIKVEAGQFMYHSLTHHAPMDNIPWPKNTRNKILDDFTEKFQAMITSLKAAAASKSDW